jgi:NTP pyrophosphatase (non-canonical NTP hydrolase)
MINAQEFVDFEMKKAKEKHPIFPHGSSGLSIIVEEVGELAESINDVEDKYRQIEEAAHVAVTAIRFIEELLKDDQSR